MSLAIDASRSLAACLRCRKQKLKCGGPGRVPCQRCRRSNAECVFVAPKQTQGKPHGAETNSPLALLEQRLNLIEEELRGEIQELKTTVERLTQAEPVKASDRNASPNRNRVTAEIAPSTHLAEKPAEPASLTPKTDDVVSSGITTEGEWDQLHDFFKTSCKGVVAFFDDDIFPSPEVIHQNPLVSAVVCTIASRAIQPEKYHLFLAEVDLHLKNTFQGPAPSILDFWAMMLLAAWTGRTRLWGYIASIGGELRLNEAALQFGNIDEEHPEDLVGRARAWFTLCCFDLMMNLSTPFVINRMKDYLPYSKKLIKSPHCRPVDYRICAYIEGFTIAGDVKAQLRSSQLRTRPLSQVVVDCLSSFDERVDAWFHRINNDIEPLCQTFDEIQDRNRFMIPYGFLKLYVNGLALHSIESEGDLESDMSRIALIKKALDNASLIIQAQAESDTLRKSFRYTMDYAGTTTYRATSFILKALPVAYQYVDCKKHLTRLQEAAMMFEQAGAVNAADELRRGQQRLASLAQISPVPAIGHDEMMEDAQHGLIFDIPNFLDDVTWDIEFPTLGTYMLE